MVRRMVEGLPKDEAFGIQADARVALWWLQNEPCDQLCHRRLRVAKRYATAVQQQ